MSIDPPPGAPLVKRWKELGWWLRGSTFGRIVWDRDEDIYFWVLYERDDGGELIETMRKPEVVAAHAMFALFDAMQAAEPAE